MSSDLSLPTLALSDWERAAPFDVHADLPEGTTLLEASAGTGKTATIAALATRFVAEGRAELGELLLVTFGRAATSELRDRVRARLVRTRRGLADPSRAVGDPLVAHLADVDADEVVRRRARLSRALADFDAATIATTHQFCQQMITRLGLLVDDDPDPTNLGEPEVDDLVDEVVDDVYLRRYATDPQPAIGLDEARRAARRAVDSRLARLEPVAAQEGSAAWHRVAFARDVLAEVALRKRVRRLHDFDDLLVLLRDALTDPVLGEQAARRVRERYRVVLVDEFQDTDPVQWQILRTAFHGHRTLVLIGDPKQAVYAFRGGDVAAYLSAGEAAGHRATLQHNWRSDPALLGALQEVFGGAALGDERIVVRPVTAAGRTGHAADAPPVRLRGAGAPLRIRHVRSAAFGSGRAAPLVSGVRELICLDVADQVVATVTGAEVFDAGAWRPVRPSDIAVLARRNADAVAVRETITRAGVPAVVSGVTSVFGSDAARDWLRLLDAVTDPGHGARAAALALTAFVGWDAARLATAGETERDRLARTVRDWSRLLSRNGAIAVLEAASADGLAERLALRGDGERLLTDLRHVAEMLHRQMTGQRLGLAALATWLRRHVEQATSDYTDERSRRLETDADALQVLTVHASKGLEFPIVFVPFGWDRWEPDELDDLRLHDPSGERLVHIGGRGSPGYDEARTGHLDEERGEDLRLLYVALTRARSQVVTWWSTSTLSARGPLGRVLFGGHRPGDQPPPVVSVTDERAAETLAGLAARSGSVAVEAVAQRPRAVTWQRPAPPVDRVAAAEWTRTVDRTWRRYSYSGLTAQVHLGPHEAPLAPDDPGTGGEPGGLDRPAAAQVTACPLGPLPAGAAFGTLVHEVLEQVAGDAEDDVLVGRLRYHAGERAGVQLDAGQLDTLAEGLALALSTPLGPLAEQRRLRDVPASDRLVELAFELPLAPSPTPDGSGATAGRRGGRPARLSDIAALLRRHLPADDPLAGYPDQLDRLATERASGGDEGWLRGFLTGSLDLVLRVPAEAGPRYLVADYKTNRLAPPEVPLTTWHYRAEALAEEMVAEHYPLQLLLYLVALHRFLRWRQPGYHPDVHLGGGLYLFLRGMCSTTEPVGVMAWRPPTPVVTGLSALLDGRGAP